MSGSNSLLLIFIGLMCLFTLLDIEGEIKSQRTPDQIAEIQRLEALERQTEQLMAQEQEKQNQAFKDMAWGDVSSIAEFMMKCLAHGYHVWLFVIALVASGPMIVRRLHESRY